MKASREKAIKHSLRFPAKLLVNHDGLQKVSNGPGEAVTFGPDPVDHNRVAWFRSANLYCSR